MHPGSQRAILVLCTDPGIPVFGRKGSATHLRELARAFTRLGYRVCVATAGPVETIPPECPFEVLPLPSFAGGPGGRWLGFDGRLVLGSWAARRALVKTIVQKRPVFIYERWSLYGTAGAALARQFRLPRILEVNTLLSREARTRLHFPRWAERVERRVLRQAPMITAISPVMRDILVREIGVEPKRILVSPMGIDPARFHPDVSGLEHRRRVLPDASGEPPALLGYIGSFNSYHRPEWLLDLAAGLRERGMTARVVVIGGVPQKVERHRAEARRRGIEDLLIYLGALDHAELPGWLLALDLMVVPGAAAHSSPTKIVEAAACGVPQVIPDYPPIRSLVGDLGEDVFFAPEDREGFITRVERTLRTLEPARETARRWAPEFARRHDWKCRAREILEAVGERPFGGADEKTE